MLLAVDIGNTNITIGVFDGQELKGTYRMTTKKARTSDEFGISIKGILLQNEIDPNGVGAVVVASVVPDVMYSFNSAITKYFNLTPLVIGPGVKTGMPVKCDDPKSVGADRIVDAVGAYTLYGGPVLVLDFGTATTYDLVDAEGAFVSGVTAPGIRTAARALWQDAAKLPEIEIKKPESILAKETISSMQAGLVYGQIGQTEYIVKNMIKESGYEGVKVVATGGLGKLISNETDCIDVYDANLTLHGIRLIYEKQDRK